MAFGIGEALADEESRNACSRERTPRKLWASFKRAHAQHTKNFGRGFRASLRLPRAAVAGLTRSNRMADDRRGEPRRCRVAKRGSPLHRGPVNDYRVSEERAQLLAAREDASLDIPMGARPPTTTTATPVAATASASERAPLFRVVCFTQSGSPVLFRRYRTRDEAEAAAAALRKIGCLACAISAAHHRNHRR